MAINTSIIQTLLKQTFNKDIEVTMGDWYNTPPITSISMGVDFSIFQQSFENILKIF